MSTRDELRAKQEMLMHALVSTSEPPNGFESDGFKAAADSLLLKRQRNVRKLLPEIFEYLDDTQSQLFIEYSRQFPLKNPSPASDAHEFFQWLLRSKSISYWRRLRWRLRLR